MWIIILSTLAVAFVSGISIGAFVERGLWESALGRASDRIDAHRRAADRRRRFRVIDGGPPNPQASSLMIRRELTDAGADNNWRRAA